MQGHGQFAPQSFAGHLQDVVDSGFAGGRLQVQPGAAMKVEDVALAVDERAGRGDLLQQRLFGQLAQRQFHGECRFPAARGSAASIAVMGGRKRPRAARWAP